MTTVLRLPCAARRVLVGSAVACGGLLILLALLVFHPREERGARPPARLEATAGGPPAARAPMPADRSPLLPGAAEHVSDAEGLRSLVRWMEGLPRAELLRLSNAEFGFEKSDLVDRLRAMTGDWVVPELGSLAIRETDPLVRAVLVAGLCQGSSRARLDDPRMLEQISGLLPQLAAAESDPYRSARFAMFAAYGACLRQKADYAALVLPHLEGSDNPEMLVRGYLFLGDLAGADDVLVRAVGEHPSAEGRFGALEGLRRAGLSGRIPPDEVARVGLAALEKETESRNRTLLVEMIATAGGEAGLGALESIVARGERGLVGPAASMLAVKMEPDRAQRAIEGALSGADLSPEDRGALYQALGAVPGERSGERILSTVRDEAMPGEERLQALRGLWNRPVDDDLRRELSGIVDGDAPGAMRAESLRMLAFSGTGSGASIDARKLAEEDRDADVRREAVMLSALEPNPDSRGWLEERLLRDRSPEVQAAALGALVVQARFTGDGDVARRELERVRRSTDDPSIRTLVERGERMVDEYDPRRIEFELKENAELYRDVALYTSGAARQAMQRQAEYFGRMVEALGAR